jgi:peptidoglycan/LPS O-acetylase OafA/YrhL
MKFVVDMSSTEEKPESGSILQWTLLVVLVLLLLGTGYLGVKGGLDATHNSKSMGQWISAFCQLAYGVAGFLAVAAMAARLRLATQLIYAWVIATIITGALAPVTWGGQPPGMALVAGLTIAMIMIIPIAIWRNRPPGVKG